MTEPTDDAPTRMDPTIRTRWVTALRSDDYRQGRGLLARRDDAGWTFCCLGVLCELAVADGVVTRATACSCGSAHNHVDEADRHWYAGCDTQLPAAVARWAGLSSANPVVDGVDLATYNDGHNAFDLDGVHVERRSFDEIAQLIEEHL